MTVTREDRKAGRNQPAAPDSLSITPPNDILEDAPEKFISSDDGQAIPYSFHDDFFDTYIQRNTYATRATDQPSLKKTSRRLCFVLRWGAPSLSLTMTKDGYVKLQDLR